MLLEAQTHSKQNKCSLGARINRNRVSKLERVLSRDGISTVALRFPRWLLQQKTHFVFLSKTRKFSLDFGSWSIISLYERCGRRGNSCCCSANRLVFHIQNVFCVVITLFYFSQTSISLEIYFPRSLFLSKSISLEKTQNPPRIRLFLSKHEKLQIIYFSPFANAENPPRSSQGVESPSPGVAPRALCKSRGRVPGIPLTLEDTMIQCSL